MLSINKYLSNEVLFVLENQLELKIGEDIILPANDTDLDHTYLPKDKEPQFNFEGSHIHFTKDKSQLCYINKHRLNHYDKNNYVDLYNIEKRFSGSACAHTTPKFRRIFAKCGITLSSTAEHKLDAYFASFIISSFKIIDNPSEVYSMDYGYDRCGTLGNSCMQAKDSDYFEMYDEEEYFKLLVAYSKDLIVGRSLLIFKDNDVFMDRRYGSNDNIEKAIKEYGLKQGWFVKSNNNMNSVEEWEHKDNIEKNIEVTLNINFDNYNCFPYMDTFKYADKYNNTLSTIKSNRTIELTSTSGGPDFDCISECEHCESMCHDDDMRTAYHDGREIDICENCREAFFSYCDHCESYNHDDDIQEVSNGNSVCQSCIDDDYTRCDECEEITHNDDIRYFTNCEVSICEDCRC